VREPLKPTEPFDINREGGFGLHIINALTDDSRYTHASGVNQMEFGFYNPSPVTA
jgi:anti-sigma regulatory factor (Ser/Thr protein kinase)